MVDTNRCKMLYEGNEEEYEEYYDYGEDEEELPQGGCGGWGWGTLQLRERGHVDSRRGGCRRQAPPPRAPFLVCPITSPPPNLPLLPRRAAGALVLSEAEAGPSASYELVLAGSGGGGSGGGGGKIIGSREFARYYRQVRQKRAAVT